MSKSNKIEQKKGADNKFELIAIKFTKWIGSPSSIVIHTIFFLICFLTVLFGVELEKMLLFLTTVVSLEAIYLAILIQLTVNRNTTDLLEVGKELDEIQEDVEEIQEDIDEMQEDVEEIQEDIDEIQDDVDDIEEGDTEEEKRDKEIKQTVEGIQKALEHLMQEISSIKKAPLHK
jgi:peptidoglycan hydrolase CwlO-like protein